MLEQARIDTENKVKSELKGIWGRLQNIDAAVDDLLLQLDAVEPADRSGMDMDSVSKNLAQVEETWGQEIKVLKEELHQTILAHNHNADLIKHHKETIDELRTRATRLNNGGAARSGADLKAQYERLESLPKYQASTQKLEPLMERLAKLEKQLQVHFHRTGAGKGGWPSGYPAGMPGFGMGGMPGRLGGMPDFSMGGMPGRLGMGAGLGAGLGAGFMGASGFMGAVGMAGKGKGAGRASASAAAMQQLLAAQAAQAAHAQAFLGNPEALAAAMAGAAELGGDDGM